MNKLALILGILLVLAPVSAGTMNHPHDLLPSIEKKQGPPPWALEDDDDGDEEREWEDSYDDEDDHFDRRGDRGRGGGRHEDRGRGRGHGRRGDFGPPMGGPPHRGHGHEGHMGRLHGIIFCLLAIVFVSSIVLTNIILAFIVGGDLRRNRQTAAWFVVVLLSGPLGAAAYALFKIASNKEDKDREGSAEA